MVTRKIIKLTQFKFDILRWADHFVSNQSDINPQKAHFDAGD